MAIQRGNSDRAASEYLEALRYTDSPEVARRATRIALYADKPRIAYQAARVWAQGEPDSMEAQKAAAELALRVGESNQLETHADAILEAHGENLPKGFRALADILSGEPAHADSALAAMQSLVQAHAKLPEAHYALGLLAMRYDRLELADGAAAQAFELKPDWHQAALLRAGILVRDGRVPDATALVDSLGGAHSRRIENRLAYGRILLDAERNAIAAEQFERVLEMDPDNVDARYGIGLIALSAKDWERAERAFTRLYENDKRRDSAAFFLGNIAEARQRYAHAQSWYEKVEDGPRAFDAELRAARMIYQQGDLAAARERLRSLRAENPKLAERLYLAEGELLYDARKHEAALDLYLEALRKYPSHPDVLYARSLVWDRVGEIQKAEADLRTILSQDPDDARALNALGYILANHTDRHQEALGYIERALEAQPDDPAVIDSMGWVQYRLGNLKKAREYLQRAYDSMPEPEIAAHLGEVLWKLGERNRARGIWQKALDEAPEHPVLNETVRRLTE